MVNRRYMGSIESKFVGKYFKADCGGGSVGGEKEREVGFTYDDDSLWEGTMTTSEIKRLLEENRNGNYENGTLVWIKVG
jgi:hypothetical protein